MSVARELAAFATTRTFHEVPSRAIDYAQMLVASTVASAALGYKLESSRILRALEVERGGKAQATLWFGAAERLPVAAVARINALMSDAAASDDSDLRNIVHCGTTACAAALAVAENTGSSGEDVLAAVALGYEVCARINTSMQGGLQTKGFHGCVVASFAGTVAAARLMKLDAAQMMHALALTATSVGGLHAAAATSLAREYHAGLAAMLGVNAAQAAALGYTAEEEVFEMPRGFCATFGNGPDVAGITRDMGSRWILLTEMGIKLMPGGSPFHAIAEAAGNAAREGNVDPEQVAAIHVSMVYRFKGPQFPTDLIGIAHSPAYFAAAGVADRDYNWAHAFAAKINDPRIRALLPKVRIGDPPRQDAERYKSGATVTIEMTDGRKHANTVYAPRGAAVRGIEWVDIEAKYRALVPYADIAEPGLEASLKAIRHMRGAKDVSALVGLLRSGAAAG